MTIVFVATSSVLELGDEWDGFGSEDGADVSDGG
jgi:hypothetical protein